LAVFAGVWTTWTGRRGTKANPVEGQHTIGFLTWLRSTARGLKSRHSVSGPNKNAWRRASCVSSHHGRHLPFARF
jgi:hypothetical protein